MEDILIKIIGKQQGSEDAVTLELPGSYHIINGKHFLQYDEATENGTIRNNIKISATEVTYTKKDAFQTRMYFALNKTTQINYYTPYGVLPLEAYTSKLNIMEATNQIELMLEYTLYDNGAVVSENILQIITKSSNTK